MDPQESFSPAPQFKSINFFGVQSTLWYNSHIHIWLLEKSYLWLYGSLLSKWCLCFLIHSLGCHCFSSKEQASFNFVATITICSDFTAQEDKMRYFHFFPIYLHEMMGPDAMILIFWRLSLKSVFSLSSFTLIKRLFLVPLHFLPLECYHLHIWGCW